MITQPNNATVVHRPKPKAGPKRRSRIKLILGGLAAGILGLIAVVAAVVAYAFWGNPEFTDRPLVLIHSPLNLEQVSEGDGVLVHATARSRSGIRRVELWADDMLIAQRDADKDASPTSMVLSADWVPTIAGDHRLVVRAISAGDVDGQASIRVESVKNDEIDPTGAHTVQEGETLDAIAQGYGTTVEDLAVLNPGLDPAAPPAAGSEIIVPDSEPPSEGSQPIPTDSEPPPAAGEPPAPFSFLSFVGFWLFNPEPPAEPTQLRMELLSLRTSLDYEGLTCYIGMAGQAPRRYPDADWNPSTDETFTRIRSADKSNGGWNVADYLSGNRVPDFSWPENQPLPLDIACVGISGGGTQAFRLGRVELTIPPDDWDGTVRQTEVFGPEGSFLIGYRVGHTQVEPKPTPKGPDPSMTAPTELLHTDTFLLWDYVPKRDEPAIDGFRVYLNDTLMWTAIPKRFFNTTTYLHAIPPEWVHLPCGEDYTLAVTAWRAGGDDDGYESLPALATIGTPVHACIWPGTIHFRTLRTYILDGDGDYEDRLGKIGPPYGEFYVNYQNAYFDEDPILPPGTGTIEYGYAGYNGLNDSSSYHLPIAAWNFRRDPSFPIFSFEGESITLGYRIKDRDTGRCDVPSDPGCDDTICEGSVDINIQDNPSSPGLIPSTNEKCLVTYEWEPREVHSMEGYTGDEAPMPSLSIDALHDISVDGTSGAISFTIQNVGDTTWAHLPLEIEVRNRADSSRETFGYSDFYLEPGDTFEANYSPSGEPFYPCLTLDPSNRVEEIADSLGLSRTFCKTPPDLSIARVEFEAPDGGHLHVYVHNSTNAMGPIVNGNITLSVYLPDGTLLDMSQSFTGINMAGEEIQTFDLPLGAISRTDLLDGYTVQVDLWPVSEEITYDNNRYDVHGMERITVALCYAEIPDVRGDILMVPYIVGYEQEWPQDTTGIFREDLSQSQPYRYEGCRYPPRMFDIAGDEMLKVVISTGLDETSFGTVERLWDMRGILADGGVVGSDPPQGNTPCSGLIPVEGSYRLGTMTSIWRAGYVICRLGEP